MPIRERLNIMKGSYRSRSPIPSPALDPERSSSQAPNTDQSDRSAMRGFFIFSHQNSDNLQCRCSDNDTTVEWLKWSPDKTLLSDLNVWMEQHPPNRLTSMLENAHNILQNRTVRDALDMLPHGTIPIKGIVTTLLNLIDAAIKCQLDKTEICNFAVEIVKEVMDYAKAFGESDGEWLEQAWSQFQELWDIVKDICLWATHETKKHNFLRRKAKELDEWRTRLTTAKQKCSVFVNFKLMSIAQEQETKHLIRQTLQGRLARNVCWNEQGRQLCANGTRRKHLKDLKFWIRPANDSESSEDSGPEFDEDSDSEFSFYRFMRDNHSEFAKDNNHKPPGEDYSETAKTYHWITGIPGSGKSTLAATIAYELKDVLCAQYFISVAVSETALLKNLFPTLALQLIEQSPIAARLINAALKTNKADVFEYKQAEALFLKPLEAMANKKPERTFLVVIDGLDELDGQPDELSVAFSHIVSLPLPENVKILLTSRPEKPFVYGFGGHVRRIPLKTADSVQEVKIYIRAELKGIADLNDWKDWPSHEQVARLSEKANGLFHYAQTAMSWIKAEVEDLSNMAVADERLTQVYSLGMGNLADLYSGILTKWAPADKLIYQSHIKAFQVVVGCLLVLQQPLRVEDIEELLKYSGLETKISSIFSKLCSLLVTNLDIIGDDRKVIPHMHKSFSDYIQTDQAGVFKIDRIAANWIITEACLHTLIKSSSSPEAINYALQFWIQHLDIISPTTGNWWTTNEYQKIKKWLSALATASPRISYQHAVKICEVGLKWIMNNKYYEENEYLELKALEIILHGINPNIILFDPDPLNIIIVILFDKPFEKNNTLTVRDIYEKGFIRSYQDYQKACEKSKAQQLCDSNISNAH